MTQFRNYLRSSFIVSGLALGACGSSGGSTGGVKSLPPPPVALSFPAIVATATTSQEFSTKGASYVGPPIVDPNAVAAVPALSDNAQLDVRYDAASKRYEIQLPAQSTWQPIVPTATYPAPSDNLFLYRGSPPASVGVLDHRSNLQYSALLEWFTDTSSGFSAIGIATPPGNVPVAGSATYTGSILGRSSEPYFNKWEGEWIPGTIGGNINLSFNFSSGALSGTINPTLYLATSYTLPSLSFTDTIHAAGSTSFSGRFDTALAGQNSFSGLFTGPAAQELIGNFAFPYASPVDGAPRQAAGAFAGGKN